MARVPRVAFAAAVSILAAACGDPSAPTPAQPEPVLSASVASLPNNLAQLFGADVQAASSGLTGIQQALTAGDMATARSRMIGLVRLTLRAYAMNRLQDPNGTAPPSTLDAVCLVTADLYQMVAMSGPVCATSTIDHDHAQAVIGPHGGLLTTPGRNAGANFEAGTLTDTVLVTVIHLPDTINGGAGPINTVHHQYPPFYEFSTFPQTNFRLPVLVGICVFDAPDPRAPPADIAARLVLAHNLHGGRAEPLPRAVPFFLGCPLGDVNAGSPGGLGGLAGSFSPFAAVDPLDQVGGESR